MSFHFSRHSALTSLIRRYAPPSPVRRTGTPVGQGEGTLLPNNLAATRTCSDRFAGAQEGELDAVLVFLVSVVGPEGFHLCYGLPAPGYEVGPIRERQE